VDLYVQVFSFTDRIQHVFWRLTDPRHPAYDAALAEKYRGTIEAAYERMDRLVGEARAAVPKDAAFFVVSDHGFASFRRGVNLNRWLVDHGYMVLRRDPCRGGSGGGRSLDDLFESTSAVFSEVDWSRTRAYAMGLGNVYVNLAGREQQGIVRPGQEYDELCAALAQELPQLVDSLDGSKPIRRVYRRDEIYSGYDPELIPDLRVANTDGYRVSWDTVLGGIPCDEIVDNKKAWGADHCSLDPELVKGILVANRKLSSDAPVMADLAPTILAALGLPPPEGADGRSLLASP
jgi:predicted AlkP superfamily phosphohydrolase/phosphomutase